MADKYISLKICGNPLANSGFMPLVLFNNPLFEIKDSVPGGFADNSYFFTVKIENSQVVYKLIKNNVRSFQSFRAGTLIFAIAIPKGYQLENGKSPLDALTEIKDKFLSRCMTCKDSSLELYEFNNGFPDPNILNDVAAKYTLCPCMGRYIPMQGANVGCVIDNEEKIRELFNDIHYSEFAEYGEIIVAEKMNSTFNTVLNIQIPRVHKYQIIVDGRPAGEENEKTKRLTFFSNRNPKYYEKGEISFTIQQLLDGDIIPNVSLDIEKEIISVNTAFLDKPRVKNVKLAFRSSKVQSYFDKNSGNLELRYGGINGEMVPVTKNLTIALKGEKLQYLENPSGFVVHLYRGASGNYKMTGAVTYRDDALILPIEPVGQQPQIFTPIGGGGNGKNTKSLRLVFASDDIANYFSSHPREIELRYNGRPIEVTKNLTVTLNENQVNYLDDLDGFAVRLYEKAKKKFQVNQRSSVEYNGRDKLYLPIIKADNKVLTIAIGVGIGVLVAALLAAGGYFVYDKWCQKEYKCDEPSCPQTFGSQDELDNHIKEVHDTSRIYKIPCNLCADQNDPYMAKDSTDLKQHIEEKHKNVSDVDLPCIKCGEVFKTKEELKKHNDTKHPVAPTFSCDQCEQKFDTQDKLNAHKASHSTAPKVTCDKCGNKFDNQLKLNQHKSSAHPVTSAKMYACDAKDCGNKFDTQQKLDKHKLNLHAWICTNCKKKYLTRAEKEACRCSHYDKNVNYNR